MTCMNEKAMPYLLWSNKRLSRRAFLRSCSIASATALTGVSCQQAKINQNIVPQSQPLRLGLNLWAGFMPWKVAQEKNLFQLNELNAELNWFPVLSDQLLAFNAGKVDVAGMTMSDFLTGVSNGVKAKVVSVIDISLGADAIVVAPSINSLKDLSGKSASVEIGTVGHLLFLKALEQGGIPQSDVQIVNQASDAAIAALIAGRTKIAYAYEPFVSQAVNSGKGRVIFSSKNVPGLVPDLMVISQRVIEQEPEAVQRLLKVWYQTLDYRNTHLEEVLPIEAKQAGVSVEEYKNLLKGFKWLSPQEAIFTFQPRETTQSLIYTANQITEFMLNQKLLSRKPPAFTELIDERFIKNYLSNKASYSNPK